jgi:glycosyltransferase involved in cell wall biosynthesis
MNIIIVSNYFFPEIGAAPNRIFHLAKGLKSNNHQVDVVCPLPNYPKGKILHEYRGRVFKKECIDGIKTFRYWIYPSVSSNTLIRIFSMISFALSSWFYGFNLKRIKNADWIIIQNSPLLVSFSSVMLFKYIFRKRIALNISDLWPLSALELGAIRKGIFYSLLQWIERFNYNNADLIIGQSQEIIEHTKSFVNKPSFLYRNIQPNQDKNYILIKDANIQRVKLIYAGLLGVAQGVYEIVSNVNFKQLGAELHIYGHGNEEQKIKSFIEMYPQTGIIYKGSVSKAEIQKILPKYHASIVPLKKRIHGAVPSKIFELIHLFVPVLFCGGGEGAQIVEQYQTGFTSSPGDMKALEENIKKLTKMQPSDYNKIRQNCQTAASKYFDFSKQLTDLIKILQNGKE